MPKTQSGADSASNPKVARVKGKIGKPNQTVSAIREQYAKEQKRQQENYAKASEDKIMRTLRDISKNSSISDSLTPTDKEKIKKWLTGNIYSNSNSLIAASRYLYYRSPIYSKICNVYTSMYCLDCRQVVPNFTFQKGLDVNATKSFDKTIDFLDIVCLKNNAIGPLLNMWIQDVSYNLFFHDNTGSMFYNIDPSEAIIDSIYYTKSSGTHLGFAINMQKWQTEQRQSLIEWLGSPLKEMQKEYERTGISYIHVPVEYSFVIKFRHDLKNIIIPPLLPYLSQFANLNDLIDSQANADDLSFYKLIYLPLKTLSSAKNSDDWEISPDLAIDYFKIASNKAIPKGVSSAVIPGDELKTIDFSDNVSEDVNRVETSQQQILGSAGGIGALLNANKAVNNTELIKSALKAESSYILTGVLSQLEAWTETQLSLNVSNPCKVKYIPVTIFTKEDYRKSLMEANQYSYQFRLAYGTLMGYSERETMASLMFESQVMKLQDLMQYPLQSSYTTSNDGTKGEVGQGAPEKDAGDLSPSGERSRNK